MKNIFLSYSNSVFNQQNGTSLFESKHFLFLAHFIACYMSCVEMERYTFKVTFFCFDNILNAKGHFSLLFHINLTSDILFVLIKEIQNK